MESETWLVEARLEPSPVLSAPQGVSSGLGQGMGLLWGVGGGGGGVTQQQTHTQPALMDNREGCTAPCHQGELYTTGRIRNVT